MSTGLKEEYAQLISETLIILLEILETVEADSFVATIGGYSIHIQNTEDFPPIDHKTVC